MAKNLRIDSMKIAWKLLTYRTSDLKWQTCMQTHNLPPKIKFTFLVARLLYDSNVLLSVRLKLHWRIMIFSAPLQDNFWWIFLYPMRNQFWLSVIATQLMDVLVFLNIQFFTMKWPPTIMEWNLPIICFF